MNIKRILATILCSAMILTSGTFSSVAYAGELNDSDIILTEESLDDEIIAESPEKETAESEQAPEVLEEGEISLLEEAEDETADTEDVEAVPEEILPEEEILDEVPEEDLLIEEEEITEESLEEIDELAIQASIDLLEVNGGELAWKDPSSPTNFKDLGKTLYVPEDCEVIPDEMFKNDAYLESINVSAVENTLETIGESAFEGCNKLTKFTASKALRTILDKAFYGCTSLSTVGLSGVVSIGESAFQNTGVVQVVASNCEEVLDNAFNGCTNLLTVSLSSVECIGQSAFSGCTSLKSLGLPIYGGTLYHIGDFAFKNTALTEVDWAEYYFSPDTTPDSYLGTGVFSDCKALKYIYLPAVETIPSSFLANCSALTTVIFNRNYEYDSVHPIATKAIDSGVFSNCTALKSIDLGLTYKVMTSAFSGDINLTEVKFQYDGRWDDVSTGDKLVIDNYAFPSLATPAKLTLKGYVNEVHDYADSKGFKFESLNELHNIVLTARYCTMGVSAANRKARVDDLVTISVKFEKDDEGVPYILDDLDIEGKNTHTKYHAWLLASGKNTADFQFYMPAEDITITAKAIDVNKLKDIAKLDRFSVEALSDGGYVPAGGNGKYTIDANGRQFKIQYYKPYNCTGDKNWQWLFTSNDTSVVRVDALGNVTAIGAGAATITASLKNSRITVPLVFRVDSNLLVKEVVMNPIAPPRESLKYDAVNDIHYIFVNKSHVEKSAMSFYTYINAYDENDESIVVTPSYWSSVDPKIATVASKNSYDNSMKITIPKGAVGETMIKAYALNPGETKVNENSVGEIGDDGHTENLARLVIRVVDATPRLITNSFDVDYKSSIGTKINLLEVYADGESDFMGLIDKDTGLDIVRKKTVKGEVTADPTGIDIEVYYDPLGTYNDHIPAFYAKINDAMKPMKDNDTITYKDVFLHGYFDRGEKAEFFIPLGKINITNKPFDTKISLSGKINTFYGNCPENFPGTKDDKRGFVTVNQTQKNVKIEYVKLVDALHYRNPGSPEIDLFSGYEYIDEINSGFLDPANPGNFIIERDQNDITKMYIYMNPDLDALQKDKAGKTVVSGYIVIKFVGYDKPVAQAITVSSGDTKPNYVLSTASGSMNYYALGQKASFYLYTKGDAKKKPINLEEYVSADPNNIRFNKELTVDNVFEDTIALSKLNADDEYKSVMTIKQNDAYAPQAGRAVIRLHHPTWAENKFIDYTYKLSVVKTKPLAKAYGSNTANLNQKADWAQSVIYFYSNQDNVPISSRGADVTKMCDSVAFTGNKKLADAAELVLDMIEPEVVTEPKTGKTMLALTVTGCPDPDDVPKGKYTFKLTPIVDYTPNETDGDPAELKPVSFAVNITSKAITLTPKAALVFNKDCAGLEEVITTYALKNMPAGTKQRDYEVDLTNATFENANKKSTVEYDDIATAPQFYPDEDDTKNTCYMSAMLADTKMKKDEPFKHTFVVSGAEVNYDDGDMSGTSTLADFKVTIQMKEVTGTFALKTSGSINMVDTWKRSAITCTASFKNFNTKVTNVTLTELDDNLQAKAANEFFDLSGDYRYEEDGTQVINNDKIAYITLKPQPSDPDKRVVPGKKYKVKLEYTLSARDNWKPTKIVEIVVKQSNPALTVKYDINKMYAGQEGRTVNVKIKPTSSISLGRITDVQFKNGKDDTYYQAFKINRESDDEDNPATTMYQERDGYKRPVFIDYTNTKSPLKMYVNATLNTYDTMYELQDGDILYYADAKIDKVLMYEDEEFIVGKMVKDPSNPTQKIFEPTLLYDKYLTLANVKPDVYYTFSMTLINSSALVLNKEHAVTLVAVLEDQSKDTKGTAFNVKINILK